MTSEQTLIAIIVSLVVLAFIAYLVRTRLTGITVKSGKNEVSLTANARGPGVNVSEVEAASDVSAVDQTGAGVSASKIKTGGAATFRNEGPGKKA
jgi:hypothetical protein